MSCEKALPILIEAIKKNLELWEKSEWKGELIDIAPPVLWFGNFNSPEENVLTIGANPSRCEFLERDNERVCREPLKKPRFAALRGKEDLKSLLGNKKLLEKIIDSYNSYFEVNPYSGWFGIKDGGKVEGFVNGLSGSFYKDSKNGRRYTAIHTDLFPFATLSNFQKIQRDVERDLFKTGWANKTLSSIVQLIRPKAIVVFAEFNEIQYRRLIRNLWSHELSETFQFRDGKNEPYDIKLTVGKSYEGIPTALIDLYLGNPIGANICTLNEFGKFIGEKLNIM